MKIVRHPNVTACMSDEIDREIRAVSGQDNRDWKRNFIATAREDDKNYMSMHKTSMPESTFSTLPSFIPCLNVLPLKGGVRTTLDTGYWTFFVQLAKALALQMLMFI
ncbi:hypothetical protein ACFE04_011180 [Oxalis oulophora]